LTTSNETFFNGNIPAASASGNRMKAAPDHCKTAPGEPFSPRGVIPHIARPGQPATISSQKGQAAGDAQSLGPDCKEARNWGQPDKKPKKADRVRSGDQNQTMSNDRKIPFPKV
jgi:hypothetical protein